MTWAHRIKHVPCGLHFTAYSWKPDWTPSFCPECGGEGGFAHWRIAVEGEIYEYVPGDAALISVGGGHGT